LQVRPLLAEVVEPRFEILKVVARVAAAFGENDERVLFADLADHQINRALVDLDFFAIDQNGIETAGDVGPDAAFGPVVLGGGRLLAGREKTLSLALSTGSGVRRPRKQATAKNQAQPGHSRVIRNWPGGNRGSRAFFIDPASFRCQSSENTRARRNCYNHPH